MCRDKAEKIDRWWVPSAHGDKLIKSLILFEMKLINRDNVEFPRRYPRIPYSQEDSLSFEPKWLHDSNKLDYLNSIDFSIIVSPSTFISNCIGNIFLLLQIIFH